MHDAMRCHAHLERQAGQVLDTLGLCSREEQRLAGARDVGHNGIQGGREALQGNIRYGQTWEEGEHGGCAGMCPRPGHFWGTLGIPRVAQRSGCKQLRCAAGRQESALQAGTKPVDQARVG